MSRQDDRLVLSTHDLTLSSKQKLDTLVRASNALGLEHLSWASYHAAVNEKTIKFMDLRLEHQDLKELSDTLAQRTHEAKEEFGQLTLLLNHMRERRDQSEQPMVDRYRDQIPALTQPHPPQPDNHGLTQLQALEKEVQAKEQALNDTQQDYPVDDLPTSLVGLQERLHQTKAQEERLVAQRNSILANLSQ
ncbi:hypothetical protein DM01DRAFT_1405017 [Hesseltinella vesiculosa]|uniref:Uncharacterized protein n=1 Tax=Hesseltinella vesiculosa TaxID=101127 RepID=A0A1X2GQW8_9FUNG|nr:hypothetical protein DM01DRAFT_1405017 [Hesseltinella vesiculosa]